MESRNFRWFIRKKNGASFDWLSVDGSGTVTATTSATPINPITYAPRQWGEQLFNWERRFPECGVLRTYTVPFTLPKDGAKILRHYYANEGVNSALELYVERYNNTLAVQDWEFVFKGEITLVPFDSEQFGVTVEVMGVGPLNNLDAKESTTFEIDVTDSGQILWVKLHSNLLSYQLKWLGSTGETVPEDFFGNCIPTLTPLEGEGTNIYFDTFDQNFTSPIRFIDNKSSSAKTFELEFGYSYEATTTGAAPTAHFSIGYQTHDIATNTMISHTTVYTDGTTLAPGATHLYSGTVTASVTLNAGEGIYIETYIKNGAGALVPNAQKSVIQKGSYVKLISDTLTPETYFPCRKVFDLARELIETKISGGEVTLVSNLLETIESDKLVTCGNAIRNFPHARIKTSWNDFKQSIASCHGAAWNFDLETDTLTIEPRGFFFDNTVFLDLGEVSNFHWKPFTSEMFSRYINGFDEKTYDNVNGKDDPNTKTEWSTPFTKIRKDTTDVSAYDADRMGILLASLNLEGKLSTDADSDNRNWFIHADLSAVAGTIPNGYEGAGQNYYNLYRDSGLTITNVHDPSGLFNVRYSPKRNLTCEGNGDYIHSLLDNLDTEYIKFQTNSKSNSSGGKMITDDGSTIIDEGEDILIGDLLPKIFKPVLFVFDSPVPIDFYSIINTTPFQAIRGTTRGIEFRGFIMKVSQEIALKSKRQFMLLCCPDVDITTLIN